MFVCGSSVRLITREIRIREKSDKGREGEEYSGFSRLKCFWKIKVLNKK